MAAPSYTTDLQDVTTAETVTGWAELSGHTSGGSATDETDYYIQGNQCISQSTGSKTGTTCGLEFDYGSDITLAAADVFIVWHLYLAANAIDTWANGGIRFGVGSSSGNMDFWNSIGNDFGRNPYGGWQSVAVDPTFTADATDGTPAGTYRIFGSLPNILSAVSKGNPHGVDVIRWGRGELIIELGDLGNGYGTFAGIATQNDNGSNRWGLLQSEGTGYLWKGLMSFGNATNLCDFRDSNTNITIEDTPRAYAAFNKIEINNASSRVDWTGVNFAALNPSQLSLGALEVVDDATVNLDTCSFTDMATFGFLGNTTLNATTFRRCGLITLGGATMSACTVTEHGGAVALICDDPSNISDTSFESSGTGHAIELTTPGTYSFVGNLFSGYGLDDTTDAAVYNNSGGAVIINVSGGGGAITVRNGTSATTTVNNTKTLTIGTTDNPLITNSEVRIYRTSDDAVLAGVENSGTTFAYDYSYTGDVPVYVHVINAAYEWLRLDLTLDATGGSIPINQRIDRIYSNP